jgi:predicted transposase/invertase (TIGR01784 family)
MKSTAVPMPPELENIDVASQTSYLWEVELEYKKDLEEAKAKFEAAEKAAKKAAEKNSKEIASKLIFEGWSLEKISEITGLSLEQVKSLTPA